MSQMETGDFNERIGVSVLNTDACRAVDSAVAAHGESSSESATPRCGHTWNRQHPGGLIVINIQDELGKKAQLFRISRAFSKKGFRSMRLSAVPAWAWAAPWLVRMVAARPPHRRTRGRGSGCPLGLAAPCSARPGPRPAENPDVPVRFQRLFRSRALRSAFPLVKSVSLLLLLFCLFGL